MRRRRPAILCTAMLLALAATCGCQTGVQSVHRMIEGQAIQRTLDYHEPIAEKMQRSEPRRHDGHDEHDEHDEKPTSKCGCSRCSS